MPRIIDYEGAEILVRTESLASDDLMYPIDEILPVDGADVIKVDHRTFVLEALKFSTRFGEKSPQEAAEQWSAWYPAEPMQAWQFPTSSHDSPV